MSAQSSEGTPVRSSLSMFSGRALGVSLFAIALVASSCTSANEDDATGGDSETAVAAVSSVGLCDDLDPASCLLPWPNDRFTRADSETSTGIRVDLPADGTPQNAGGTPIGVDEWNRNDGFSPAAIPMTVIPGLDPEASGLAPVTDIGASLAKDSSLVLVDLESGKRIPAWAELDSVGNDPQTTPLLIVPATSLVEGHRHAVALRNLVSGDGNTIEPRAEYMDQLAEPDQITQQLVDGLAESGLDADDMTTA